MTDASLVCTDPFIADGKINRFHVEGDRPGTKNGWYIFYPDSMPAGAFGSWKNGETHTWCSKRTETMTEAERAEYRKRIEHARAKREQQQKEAQAKACDRARKLWVKATRIMPDRFHPYLAEKHVKAYGVRIAGTRLVIPVRDPKGKIQSIQYIVGNGKKRFLKDGVIQGHYHTIGKLTDILYIVEGYATGASVYEATGCGVVVAFDAGNLLPVAKAIREKYPDHELLIAGDNDAWTDGNPGVTKANVTAKIVNAKVVIPAFKDTTDKLTDFNDLHRLEGLDAVREQLQKAHDSSSSETKPVDSSEAASEAIAALAELSPIEYEQRRKAEANKLDIRVGVLDKEVGKLSAIKNGGDMAGSAVSFEGLEQWPLPVDTTELLNELVSAVKLYVALLEHTPEAIALWVLHAHAHDAATISPILAITSPEKRCGKTTKLSVLQAITPRPLFASNLTVATLFRAIEQYRPTLLVDEADTFLRDNEELRGILNSGHTRNGACVLRTVGDAHELRTFSTWGPKAIALIGNISPTLQDRSIVIQMRRKRPDDTVERFRLDRTNELKEVARRCARWAVDNMGELRGADP
ncbi:MAG: toprim domain-containing protein, partial [Gammaproteobacteria bacterium]|nr:toprim domain-containing protein [Gammaproteobacteria bacterium]